jgi:hypothetical protein
MHSVIERIFDAKIAKRGGIVRRSLKSLIDTGSYEALLWEARSHGYPVYQIADQIVVFCTRSPKVKRLA